MITIEQLERAKTMYEMVRRDPYKKLEIDVNLLRAMIESLDEIMKKERKENDV